VLGQLSILLYHPTRENTTGDPLDGMGIVTSSPIAVSLLASLHGLEQQANDTQIPWCISSAIHPEDGSSGHTHNRTPEDNRC
jgi:hypothetical protein